MATHQRREGVRHPEGHPAASAEPVEVAELVEKAEADVRLDDDGGAEGMVEATQGGFIT